jgi:hypothetical protein
VLAHKKGKGKKGREKRERKREGIRRKVMTVGV